MNIPDWLKSSATIIILIILWDIVRIPIQAWVTKKFMEKQFNEIDGALEDVEKAMEENGEEQE